MVAELLEFTDTDIKIKIYDNNIYYNDIINNSESYKALISYLGEPCDEKKNDKKVYNVKHIYRIALKKDE